MPDQKCHSQIQNVQSKYKTRILMNVIKACGQFLHHYHHLVTDYHRKLHCAIYKTRVIEKDYANLLTQEITRLYRQQITILSLPPCQ